MVWHLPCVYCTIAYILYFQLSCVFMFCFVFLLIINDMFGKRKYYCDFWSVYGHIHKHRIQDVLLNLVLNMQLKQISARVAQIAHQFIFHVVPFANRAMLWRIKCRFQSAICVSLPAKKNKQKKQTFSKLVVAMLLRSLKYISDVCLLDSGNTQLFVIALVSRFGK